MLKEGNVYILSLKSTAIGLHFGTFNRFSFFIFSKNSYFWRLSVIARFSVTVYQILLDRLCGDSSNCRIISKHQTRKDYVILPVKFLYLSVKFRSVFPIFSYLDAKIRPNDQFLPKKIPLRLSQHHSHFVNCMYINL